MKKKHIALICFAITSFSSVMACSNIAVKSHKNLFVARTMDYEENTGNIFALGRIGHRNKSDTNMSLNAKPLTWINRYNFMGQTAFNNPNIVDGINSKGLYAGYLYLPGETVYPKFNINNHKPALGVFDVVNYVLGSASSVSNALNLLGKVQIVKNAVNLHNTKSPGVYGVVPIHVVLRDKSGHSAVIEFINGKVKTINNSGEVVTNSPNMHWQIKNASRYKFVRTNNTNQQFDGQYMNGSGFVGIPGDWTPPGRFARATQVIKHFPQAHNDQQGLSLTRQALAVVEVPLGVNPSATIWESISNLDRGIYYFRPVLNIVNANTHTYNTTIDSPNSWQKWNLKSIAAKKSLPKGWINATITPSHSIVKVVELMQPTAGKAVHSPRPHFSA